VAQWSTGWPTGANPRAAHWHSRNLLRFPGAYWLIVGICVTFYSVIFPFRSTFSIKYFQEAHGLTLEAASIMNSHVFLAAMFATPLIGLLVDRFGRHALLLTVGALALPLSFVMLASSSLNWATVLIGISFSMVPAVLWPSVARYVSAGQLGTAFGLMTALQQLGVFVANIAAGGLNDLNGAGAGNPAGYDAMLWFFGLLSLAALVCAALLLRRPALAN
jgi:MFS family permease